VRTALAVAPDGIACRRYEGLASLPHFNPDDDFDPLPPAVVELRASIAAADAVLFCTPEYAGALPGSFKNLLDWTVGGGEMYEKRVAWINASGLPTGAADAHASLRKVLGYLATEIVEEACAHVPVPRQAVSDDGLIADPQLRARIADVLTTLAGRSTPAP
jgi:chromate reductase